MKKIFTFSLLIVLTITSYAQYYNPYSVQDIGSAQQDAYQRGAKAGRIAKLIVEGKSDLGIYDDEEAYKKFYEACYEHDSPDAFYWLGIMFECGWYVKKDNSMAKECYRYAAKNGRNYGIEKRLARQALVRIAENGYLTEAGIKGMRSYFINSTQATIIPDLSPSSSDKITCHSCIVKGQCKYCNGTGKDEYTRNKRCGVCLGTGRCAGCDGKGSY